MLIEYTPPSPRAGVQEHVSQTTAAALIAAGFAREVILSEEEKKALRFGNFGKAPIVHVPEWNVVNSSYTGKLLIQRRYGCESMLFDGRPDAQWKCPPEIVKEYEARLERERLARVADKRDRDRAADSLK
jgi:hypothetical protein